MGCLSILRSQGLAGLIGLCLCSCASAPTPAPATATVSVMEMHGAADTFIPYEGGGGLDAPPTPDVVKYWATVDGCNGAPDVNQHGNTSTTLWKHWTGTSVVRLDTVTGGHNTWFGSNLDPVSGEPNATSVIWDFSTSVQ